jgi:exodeoxyribonuclease VIII
VTIIDSPRIVPQGAIEYHADYSSVSRSMLSDLKKSPRLYYERYVAQTREPSPPSEAMIRGTRFDVLLLTPALYYQQYAIVPATAPDGDRWDRRKTAHKREWESWLLANSEREPVEADEHAELITMVAAAMRHPDIAHLASASGKAQHRLDWTNDKFQVACRCLIDKSFVSANLIVDVKTAADPSPEAFQRAVVMHGYERQQAWYVDGFRANFGKTPRFLFAVVGSTPPYDAAVYELDRDAEESGRAQNEFLLTRLSELQASGEWLPTWGKGIVTLGLPRWHDPYKSEVY